MHLTFHNNPPYIVKVINFILTHTFFFLWVYNLFSNINMFQNMQSTLLLLYNIQAHIPISIAWNGSFLYEY